MVGPGFPDMDGLLVAGQPHWFLGQRVMAECVMGRMACMRRMVGCQRMKKMAKEAWSNEGVSNERWSWSNEPCGPWPFGRAIRLAVGCASVIAWLT
ncbi:hypothetical protein E3N88_12394 [Mikania micrantha]|uniref:Uncharacterized protein n=1 Tax=Mikania micrantha TaxID=192012 RepID=A0A5N6P5D9_9ASTR|nr:hypothetical protein E3N88_12394 [Mikania micrantha]